MLVIMEKIIDLGISQN